MRELRLKVEEEYRQRMAVKPTGRVWGWWRGGGLRETERDRQTNRGRERQGGQRETEGDRGRDRGRD